MVGKRDGAARTGSRDGGRKLCPGLIIEMSGYDYLDRHLIRAAEVSELSMLPDHAPDDEVAVKTI